MTILSFRAYNSETNYETINFFYYWFVISILIFNFRRFKVALNQLRILTCWPQFSSIKLRSPVFFHLSTFFFYTQGSDWGCNIAAMATLLCQDRDENSCGSEYFLENQQNVPPFPLQKKEKKKSSLSTFALIIFNYSERIKNKVSNRNPWPCQVMSCHVMSLQFC